jgi:carbon monoxide dehydrogenase subunit G
MRDFENWIAEFEGYDAHEVADDGTITLRMRGKIGPLTKVTRLRIAIVDEQPPHRLGFAMTGVTDALEGDGELAVAPAEAGRSRVSYRLRLSGRGIAAPVLDEFLDIVVPRAIGDLAGRIGERLGAAS